jgi:DNA-binding GntR family transcriptional regulator
MHDHLFSDGKGECIYHQLKQLATHIVFRPSEQLCIKTLAEVLRVSQTPVREALIRLQTEAIVSGERLRGFFAYYQT